MIIIPAAGEGRRFREAGYDTPKHDIPLAGTPMVDWVTKNVGPLDPLGVGFVITQDFVGPTRGAVETIVKGYDKLTEMGMTTDPLVVANCDQLIDFDPDWVLGAPMGNGLVFTFKSANPAHSYVTVIDRDYRIVSIVEKPESPPSLNAVSGVYVFPNGAPFIEACREVMDRQDGELYVSAALDIMLRDGYTLYAVTTPTAILGTPEDFQRFETALKFAPGCGRCDTCAC